MYQYHETVVFVLKNRSKITSSALLRFNFVRSPYVKVRLTLKISHALQAQYTFHIGVPTFKVLRSDNITSHLASEAILNRSNQAN